MSEKASERPNWESVANYTSRLKIDGGYLYRYSEYADSVTMVFVPASEVLEEMRIRNARSRPLMDTIR